MTGFQAYCFAIGLVAGLLVPVLPVSLLLMRAPAASMRFGLRAGAIGGGVALCLAAVIGILLFEGPWHSGLDTPASDLAILAAISASLGVALAAIGAMVIALYRRSGLLTDEQAKGSAAAIVGCWMLVVGMFAIAVFA